MKLKKKKWIIAAGILILLAGFIVNHASASILDLFGNNYTEKVEDLLVGLVPEEGMTISDRTYDKEDVLAFLEEVRWAPDDYVHKDHHCVLSELPEEDVRTIVRVLRKLMDCPDTYTDVETVQGVQNALNEAGYDCGYADGILGINTFKALNSYQADHDLRVINGITEELLKELGMKR